MTYRYEVQNDKQERIMLVVAVLGMNCYSVRAHTCGNVSDFRKHKGRYVDSRGEFVGNTIKESALELWRRFQEASI